MAVDAQSGKYGPYDRDNDGIASSVDQDDDGDGVLDLNIDVMDEAEETTTTTTGMKYSREELSKMAAPDGSVTIPKRVNESTRSLLKKFLNSRK